MTSLDTQAGKQSGGSGTKRTVVVLGSCGQTARHLVCMLKDDPNITLRAGVKDNTQLARLQDEQGVQGVVFDYRDYDSLKSILRGADAAFVALPYSIDMLMWGKDVIDAAKEVGVRHLIKLSTFNQGVLVRRLPLFGWHELLDQSLRGPNGVPWTIVGGSFFMQNFAKSLKHKGTNSYQLHGFMEPNVRLGMIDTRDIARVASLAIMHPTQHRNKTYLLSTEALSGNDCAKIISEELGNLPVSYHCDNIRDSPYSKKVEAGYLRAVETFVTLSNQGALDPDLATTRTFHEVTGEQPDTLRDFFRREHQKVEDSESGGGGVAGLLERARAGIKNLMGGGGTPGQEHAASGGVGTATTAKQGSSQ